MLVFLNSWGEINKNGFGLDCFSLNLDCRPRHLWTLNFLFMNFGDSWSAVANPTVPLAICADEWRLDGQPAGATVVDAVVGFDFAEWLSWIRQSCLPPMHFVAASFFCFFFSPDPICNQSINVLGRFFWKTCFWFPSLHFGIPIKDTEGDACAEGRWADARCAAVSLKFSVFSPVRCVAKMTAVYDTCCQSLV